MAMTRCQPGNDENYEFISTFCNKLTEEKISTLVRTEEMIEPTLPHEAIFLVLSYLNLFELLRMSQVCRSVRDAVKNDVLLWLDIVVESPLNLRIDDDILLKITSKSLGRLRTLAIKSCGRITDDGLLRVAENNPCITKLYIPGCSRLTPDGIVKVVNRLTEQHNHMLKSLMLHNIHNLTKEHLQILHSCLGVNSLEEKLHHPKMFLKDARLSSSIRSYSINRSIDVEVCPKCNVVGLVFDCPKESCERKNEKALRACRGCLVCIPRCEGCGGCMDLDETGETVCLDVFCLDCWLKAPKCNDCNKAYCPQHAKSQLQWKQGGTAGFLCDACTFEETLVRENF